MTKNKLKSILWGVITLLSMQIICAKVSSVPINKFEGDFGTQFYRSGSPEIINIEKENGKKILKVKEDAKKYVSGMGVLLNNFSGMKSIYISVSIKTVNLKKNAAVFYYWKDVNGKPLPGAKNAKYLVKVSGTTEWTKYEKIVSSPFPLKTGGINIYFSVYKSEGGDGYALFKNPVVRIANAKDAEKKVAAAPKRPKQKPPLSAALFKHGFSAKMPGVPYSVERGGYGWLLLSTSTQPEKDEYQLKVSAPKSIDFELYLSNGKKATLRPSKVVVNNQNNTYIFGPMKYVAWYHWGNVLLFKAGENTPDKFNISLAFSNSKGKQIFTKSIPIHAIDPLNITIGKTSFANRMFYAYPLRRIDFSDKNAKLAREVLGYLKKRGVTSPGYLENTKTSLFPYEAGEVISHTRFLPYNVCSPSFRKLLAKYNIPMSTDVSGIRSKLEIEPQVLAERGLPFYSELLNRNKIKEYKDNELVWISDYEPYAHEGPVTKFSYAPESIEAFRKFIKAPETLKLTPRLILSKYIRPWVKFRCRQRADLIKNQNKALKEYNPKALFALCSMPLPEAGADQLKYFQEIGVDLRMMDPYVDLHLPMIYARDALFYRRAEATISQLKKPVYVIVSCGHGKRTHRPRRLFRLMTGSAFLGAPGVYHWPGMRSMDGDFIQNIQRAMALISVIKPFADHSKLIKADEYVSCPGAKSENFYYAVRRDGKNYMFFLANEGRNRTLYPEITLSEVAVNIIELVNKKKISVKKRRFKVELPPGSIKIIYSGPDAKFSGAKLVTVNTEAIERKAQAQREKMLAMHRKGAANNMSYNLKNSVLEIQTPAQIIKLDMNNCACGTWTLRAKDQQIELLKATGSNYFDYPAQMPLKNIPVELEDIKITTNHVQAIISFKIKNAPYDGLVVRKTFTIERNIPKISIKVRIIPTGGYRQFSFRVNHCSASPDAVFNIGDESKATKRFGNIYTRDRFDYKIFFDSKHIVKRGNFSTDNCGLSIPKVKLQIKCSFNKDVKALMSWSDANIKTMELIYDKIYPDNDPHRIKEWECGYTLQGFEK